MISVAAIAVLLIVFFIMAVIVKSIVIINQGEEGVTERLGRYNGTLRPGINFIIPLFDTVKRVDLREHVYECAWRFITKENKQINVRLLLYYQITDSLKATYEIVSLEEAVKKLAEMSLRDITGSMYLDEIFSSRDKINHKLSNILNDAGDKWGVKINRVELQDITDLDN